ncbi:hypothetical protein JTB14_014692 [Gonioctena quinquepunctata]|nr:hypothetical protein JTB14_014692 [Gonioctena quinquepunctata]
MMIQCKLNSKQVYIFFGSFRECLSDHKTASASKRIGIGKKISVCGARQCFICFRECSSDLHAPLSQRRK